MGNSKIKHISGALKCPMISFWVLFGLHFLYLTLILILNGYVSLIYLILDIEILFYLQFTALFITLSHMNNKYNLFIISFVISIINAIIIAFSIFIIIYSFFVKSSSKNFINPESWIEDKGKEWIGIFLIIGKLTNLIPLMVIIIYLKKLGKSSGSINPSRLSKSEDAIIADYESDENTLG